MQVKQKPTKSFFQKISSLLLQLNNIQEKHMVIVLPFLVVISALLIKFSLSFNMDSDPLWSLAVGEWINSNRAVPMVDTFSWTVAGEKWYSNSWLFCWLMFIADQSIGYLGVALVIFIPCLVTAYFLYLLCRQYNNTTFSILTFIIGIYLLILISVVPRAYIFTFAFVAIVIYLIRFKRDSKLIYTIPLVFLVWANIQNSMSFGFAILLIEALVATIFSKDRKLWLIVALSFLATLINPYGLGFWAVSLSVPFDSGSQYVKEWMAPDFNDWALLILYGFMFLVGLLGAFKLKDEVSKKSIDYDRIMTLFWFWAVFLYSLTAVRAIAYVLLLFGPFFAAFASKEERESVFLKPIILISVLLIFIASLAISLPHLPLLIDEESGRPVDSITYLEANPVLHDKVTHIIPYGAVEYMQENPANYERLFNSYIFGGYLLLKNIEVFVDARFTVYARHSVIEDYFNMTRMEAKPEIIIDEYDINTFLLAKGERLIFYLDLHPEWEKEYEDKVAVIYNRVGPYEGRSGK